MVVFGAAILAGAIILSTLLPIITGYAAKNLCSGVFVAGRDPLEIEGVDLNFMPIKLTNNTIYFYNKTVKSRFLWGSSKAIYRDGYGVTLIRDIKESELKRELFPLDLAHDYLQDTIDWPMGDIINDSAPLGIDTTGLREIVEKLFVDNGYNGTPFAFMVLHEGLPIVEAYREGFDKNTRFLSWSMAKSFIRSEERRVG